MENETVFLDTIKSSMKPPGGGGGAYFFQARLRGAKRERGLFNLVKCVNRSKVSRGRICGYRLLYCFF